MASLTTSPEQHEELLRELKTTAGIGVPVNPDDEDWGNTTFFTYALFPADGSFTPREFIEQLPAFAQRRANRARDKPDRIDAEGLQGSDQRVG